jgi:hypothetical protein
MIPKLIFKFDKEKDLYNIWETANSKKTYGYNFKERLPKKILEICSGKNYKDCNKKLERFMHSLYKNTLSKDIPKYFNGSWKKIEKEYFQRLENITKERFPAKKISVYITTCGRCPYRAQWRPPAFYVNFFGNIPVVLETAGHELMHIHLHNSDWWGIVEKEIGKDKTHDLKEALTVLLNLEFKDLWIIKDESYPNHIKLRKFISEQWKKKKDFELLTKNSIKWIKKNGVK